MYILFKELFDILKEWQKHVVHKPNISPSSWLSYTIYKNLMDKKYISKIKFLIDTIDIDNIQIKKNKRGKDFIILLTNSKL